MPCVYPFTKLSTDTMLSSVIESVFIFGRAFPLRHQEEVIACFCGKEQAAYDESAHLF